MRLPRFWLMLIGLLLSPSLVWAQAAAPELKAAFIVNIARYTEWSLASLPDGAPLRICVLGPADAQGGLYDALNEHQGKQIRGHSLEVSAGPRFDPMRPCHITVLLPGAGEKRRIMQEERNTLTLADSEEFVDQGGMIGLVSVNNRIQIEANLDSARRSGIKLSSHLLKLARKVINS